MIERIDPGLMRELVAEYGNEDTPVVYHDKHRLVRELFWRAHAGMLALSRTPLRRRALDFGGGNGVLLPTLARLYDEVVCVDLHAPIAREIVRRFDLKNVEVLEGDVFTLGLPSDHFDTVVAASVLEHIQSLGPLAAELQRIICSTGELLANAPSENRFYNLGRRVFGYVKPPDHFHNGDDVIGAVREYLVLSKRRRFPINWSPLSVFDLLRFVKAEGNAGVKE